MNTIELTKQLISIPSYQKMEKDIGNFIYKYLTTNFPWLLVNKQYVDNKRFNIFARDKYKTKLLVVDHIDSVRPSKGWSTDPLTPIENEGKIFGLGSSDTKGNIAAFLSALSRFKRTKGLSLLFYVDEEYYFEGMKKFVSSRLAKQLKPIVILSIDGEDLKIGNACRGLIEMNMVVQGKTGHSAKNNGINVNRRFMDLILDLESWLNLFSSEIVGKSTLNIAYLSGGLLIRKENDIPIFARNGNRIPDYLEALIEIRAGSTKLNFKVFKRIIKDLTSKYNLKLVRLIENFDLKGFLTPRQKLSDLMKTIKPFISKELLNPRSFGYLDVSMLQELYPEAITFSLGAGVKNQAHAANEYVIIEDLKKAVNAYEILLQILAT